MNNNDTDKLDFLLKATEKLENNLENHKPFSFFPPSPSVDSYSRFGSFLNEKKDIFNLNQTYIPTKNVTMSTKKSLDIIYENEKKKVTFIEKKEFEEEIEQLKVENSLLQEKNKALERVQSIQDKFLFKNKDETPLKLQDLLSKFRKLLFEKMVQFSLAEKDFLSKSTILQNKLHKTEKDIVNYKLGEEILMEKLNLLKSELDFEKKEKKKVESSLILANKNLSFDRNERFNVMQNLVGLSDLSRMLGKFNISINKKFEIMSNRLNFANQRIFVVKNIYNEKHFPEKQVNDEQTKQYLEEIKLLKLRQTQLFEERNLLLVQLKNLNLKSKAESSKLSSSQKEVLNLKDLNMNLEKSFNIIENENMKLKKNEKILEFNIKEEILKYHNLEKLKESEREKLSEKIFDLEDKISRLKLEIENSKKDNINLSKRSMNNINEIISKHKVELSSIKKSEIDRVKNLKLELREIGKENVLMCQKLKLKKGCNGWKKGIASYPLIKNLISESEKLGIESQKPSLLSSKFKPNYLREKDNFKPSGGLVGSFQNTSENEDLQKLENLRKLYQNIVGSG
ncbi:hypothetical protein HDU92_002068 [Lobulomyces angularis]|nr:hypothetical protein HDU92_002068 [Lobulomyces angularis]